MKQALVVFTLCFVFFFSCAGGGGNDPVPPYNPENPIEQVDELFIYDALTDTTTITTNNGAYWSPYGYTLWALNNTIPYGDFTDRVVNISKDSGDTVAGYGIVVCHAYRDDYGYTMITVMINTSGRYTVGKVIGANYESVVGWKNCGHLFEGTGISNRLQLTYDKDEKEYTLYINGYEIESFDITEPVHEEGRSGYIVVISPQDKFPSVPVSVSFKEE